MIRTVCVSSLLMLVGVAAAENHRPWTPADSVETTYLGEDRDAPPALSVSPNGRRFFVVSQRGDLATDSNIFEVWIFDISAVKEALRTAAKSSATPLRKVRLASRTNAPAIAGPRWAENGAAIAFLGAEGRDPAQVYRFELDSGTLTKLTHAEEGVISFDMQGDVLIYAALKRAPPTLSPYPAAFLSLEEMKSIYFRYSPFDEGRLYVMRKGGEARQVGEPFLGAHAFVAPLYWISPDGGKAVVKLYAPPAAIPGVWKTYRKSALDRMGLVARYLLVDTASAQARTLLDAPSVYKQTNDGVLWAPDSGRVILANTLLPWTEQREETDPELHVVDYEVRTGRYRVVERTSLRKMFEQGVSEPPHTWLDWIHPGARLLVTKTEAYSGKTGISERAYTFTGADWVESKAMKPRLRNPRQFASGQPIADQPKVALAGGTTVFVRQSMNEPPKLMASSGGKEAVVMDPPQVGANAWRANSELIRWSSKSGNRFEGLLMLPHRALDGENVPLIVQIYGFNTTLFQPDGYQPTAYAAQPLVGRGFAVLQVKNGGGQPVIDTPQEGPAIVECVDSAVDHLSSSRHIDRSRIGVIGFSRGAYNVDYLLTNPGTTRITAAVSSEGFTASYGYMLNYSLLDLQAGEQIGKLYEGGGQFWQNREKWMAHAPGFNLNRIKAAVLLSGGDNGVPGIALTHDLEFIVGLRLNGIPTDYLSFPEGQHPLIKPLERFASLTASVDWMSFWILGQKDTDIEKAGRFARWEEMRRKWKAVGTQDP